MKKKTSLILIFLTGIVLLILVGLYSYRVMHVYKESSDWVARTHKVISETQRIMSLIQDIETATRGYAISGNKSFQEPYHQAFQQIDSTFGKLKNLVVVSEGRQRLDTLRLLINKKIAYSQRIMAMVEDVGTAEAQKVVSIGGGQIIMDDIRTVIAKVIQREESILQTRLEKADADFNASVYLRLTGIGLALFIIAAAMVFIVIYLNKIETSEKQLKQFVEELKSLQQELEKEYAITKGSEEKYQMLAENITDTVTLVDMENTFQYVSPSAIHLYGYTPEELVGTKGLDLIHPEDLERVKSEAIDERQKGKQVSNVQCRIIKKDGSARWVEFSTSPVIKDHQTVGFQSLVRDITKRRADEASMVEKRQAEETNQAKMEFLSTMSHEIRTPMNAILGFAQVLNRNVVDPKLKSFVSNISSAGNSLLLLMNDILELSKITTRKIEIIPTPVNLKSFMGELKNLFPVSGENQKIAYHIYISPALPETICVDGVRLRQVLYHLLANAFKFTEEGEVELKVELVSGSPARPVKNGDLETDKHQPELSFSVRDTGIGMAPEQHELIFDAFRQVDGHSKRKYGGMGLGLAIAKRLTEKMSGTIELHSQQGIGSTFTVVLPYEVVENIEAKGDPVITGNHGP